VHLRAAAASHLKHRVVAVRGLCTVRGDDETRGGALLPRTLHLPGFLSPSVRNEHGHFFNELGEQFLLPSPFEFVGFVVD